LCFPDGVLNLSCGILQMALRIGNVQKWWEKGLQPNMKEVTSAQDLVESLLNAGDKLVVVDFFSPGCGGCKALHPKVFFIPLNPIHRSTHMTIFYIMICKCVLLF